MSTVEKKTWKEFMDCGLLWWVNRMLHLFGWAIVMELDRKKVVGVYPARVAFRGFGEEVEEKGFVRLTRYLRRTVKELEKEARR